MFAVRWVIAGFTALFISHQKRQLDFDMHHLWSCPKSWLVLLTLLDGVTVLYPKNSDVHYKSPYYLLFVSTIFMVQVNFPLEFSVGLVWNIVAAIPIDWVWVTERVISRCFVGTCFCLAEAPQRQKASSLRTTRIRRGHKVLKFHTPFTGW